MLGFSVWFCEPVLVGCFNRWDFVFGCGLFAEL